MTFMVPPMGNQALPGNAQNVSAMPPSVASDPMAMKRMMLAHALMGGAPQIGVPQGVSPIVQQMMMQRMAQMNGLPQTPGQAPVAPQLATAPNLGSYGTP